MYLRRPGVRTVVSASTHRHGVQPKYTCSECSAPCHASSAPGGRGLLFHLLRAMADSSDPILTSIRETKAKYVRLGRSGLHVSVPILGAMSFGHKDWQPWVVEEEEALGILKAAFDRGVNTWDTANVYSNGVSEEIIGKAIKKYDIPREKLVILTKCSSWVGDSPGSKAYMYREKCGQSKDYVNQGGLSRKAILSAVEASLKRMGLDYIDVLQIHRFDPHTPVEETMATLHDLVRAGTVRYIGASSMWVS